MGEQKQREIRLNELFKAANDGDGKCVTCRFFHQHQDQQGLCRVNPPTVHFHLVPQQGLAGSTQLTPFPISGWPVVNHDQWCGRYEDAPRILGRTQ